LLNEDHGVKASKARMFFITQNYPKKSSVIFQLFNTRWKNDNRLDREPLQAWFSRRSDGKGIIAG